MTFSFSIAFFAALVGAAPSSSTPPEERSRPAIFSRAQLKYGLDRDNYLSRWIDRPLLLNPALKNEGDPRDINAASLRRMKETAMKYGLDGFAFFPEVARTREIYRLVQDKRPDGFQLLSEFAPRGTERDKLDIAKMALESSASFRLGGKVVFTSYGADRLPPAHWSELMKRIRETHGDHFLFLPAVVLFGGEPPAYWIQREREGRVTDADLERIKESLREWLRHTDGLYFASTAGIKNGRRFDAPFYADFIVRIMRETLDEPEFQGKYFGLSANIGHENCTRFGYTQSSCGTLTLRQSLETALAAKPHLINIPEWDEQNENTSLRPTVYNGYSSMRILRHYTSALKGALQEPLPNDDVALPNLVVSYRKSLVLGEKLEFELLNIPDTASKGEYQFQLKLHAPSGELLYTSEMLTLAATTLNEVRLPITSEGFAGQRALVPSLTVIRDEQRREIDQGLQPIDLRSSETWDYKWVKQPIRDLLLPEEFAFSIDDADRSGARWATVAISSPEPLRYVELLDNDDVIYSHSKGAELWRENEREVVISLNWQAAKLIATKGTVRLTGAPSARWKVPPELPTSVVEGDTLYLSRLRVNHWPRRVLVAIPREAVAEAAFEIETEWSETTVLPVQRLMELSAYGVPGPDRFNLVLSRYVRQDVIPAPLETTEVSFKAAIIPDRRDSLLLVQAQGMSGRIYRSRPIIAGVSSQPQASVVWSESEEEPKSIAAPVVSLDYRFTSEHGSILTTDGGRPFFGILGGYAPQATERGGGESSDGTPFIRKTDYPAKATQSAPIWGRTPEGREVLRFDGKGTHVTLPQGAIPRRAGFSIEMEIRPEHTRARQVLIANRSYYPGSFMLLIDNGFVKARFTGETEASPLLDSRLRVEPGEWSRIQVFYNQAELWFVVNGKSSERFPVKGPGMYDTVTSIGGFGHEWFAGEMASLRIHHAPPTP